MTLWRGEVAFNVIGSYSGCLEMWWQAWSSRCQCISISLEFPGHAGQLLVLYCYVSLEQFVGRMTSTQKNLEFSTSVGTIAHR